METNNNNEYEYKGQTGQYVPVGPAKQTINHFALQAAAAQKEGAEHFKKYGHLCASRCGVECRYCYKCAEKIQKVFMKKQEEQQKSTMPFCVIN